MELQIPRLASAGATGFVIGRLTSEGRLDRQSMERLVRAAGGRNLTLHRAFDVSRDAEEAMADAPAWGLIPSSPAARLRTAGAAGRAWASCWRPEPLWKLWLEAALGPRSSGSCGPCIPLRTFHMSGKVTLPSAMGFRREGVPMGLPGLDEFSIWQTSEDHVRAAPMHYRRRFHVK